MIISVLGYSANMGFASEVVLRNCSRNNLISQEEVFIAGEQQSMRLPETLSRFEVVHARR
jgi:hypothetical protein